MGIGTTVKTTLLPFMDSIDNPDLQTVVSQVDRNKLPLYPDVVIHYRFSDNVAIRGRGLTQFHTILNTIPPTSEYVMILTESGDLAAIILTELRRLILAKFPSISQVVIRAGGDIFGSVATIVYAKTLICSVSSLCLYFGALNSIGQVYMPTKKYYGHQLNIDNFHTLKNNSAVTLWRNPDGSPIEIPLFHYTKKDPMYKEKIQISAKQMLVVLQNQTYTQVYEQHCKSTNIAKPGETPLHACM